MLFNFFENIVTCLYNILGRAHFAINLDPFSKSGYVRRDEQTSLESELFKTPGSFKRNRSFSISACNVNNLEIVFMGISKIIWKGFHLIKIQWLSIDRSFIAEHAPWKYFV